LGRRAVSSFWRVAEKTAAFEGGLPQSNVVETSLASENNATFRHAPGVAEDNVRKLSVATENNLTSRHAPGVADQCRASVSSTDNSTPARMKSGVSVELAKEAGLKAGVIRSPCPSEG
jgi:hypothetical protein